MSQIFNQMFREHRVTLPCWLCLLYALSNPFDFRLLGPRMTGGEVVASFGLVLLLPQFAKVNFRPLVVPIIMIILYALGAIVCDLYHDNDLEFFMRGFAKPLFIGVICLFFYVCFSLAPRSLLFYLYALPLAVLVFIFRAPKDLLEESYIGEYKRFVSQYGPILILWARFGGSLGYAKSKLVPAVIYGVLFVVLASFSSRSDAMLAFVTGAIFLFLAFSKSRKRLRFKFSIRRGLLIAILIGVFVSIFYGAYIYGAPRGYFGDMQREKFATQSQTRFGTSPIGFIMSGRTKSVAALLAIADHPMLGLGSRPSLMNYYYEATSYSGDSKEIESLLHKGNFSYSSGHSSVLGAWLAAGIFGALFWLYLAYVVLRNLYKILQYETLATPWFLPAFIFFYWHWAFSPIGTGARQSAGIYLALYAAFFSASSLAYIRGQFYQQCRLPGVRTIGRRVRR